MSHLPLDARAILHYLNELGYRNISAVQLKEFLKDLRKLIKYEERMGINTQQNDYYESLFRRTTASYRAKIDRENYRKRDSAKRKSPDTDSSCNRQAVATNRKVLSERNYDNGSSTSNDLSSIVHSTKSQTENKVETKTDKKSIKILIEKILAQVLQEKHSQEFVENGQNIISNENSPIKSIVEQILKEKLSDLRHASTDNKSIKSSEPDTLRSIIEAIVVQVLQEKLSTISKENEKPDDVHDVVKDLNQDLQQKLVLSKEKGSNIPRESAVHYNNNTPIDSQSMIQELLNFEDVEDKTAQKKTLRKPKRDKEKTNNPTTAGCIKRLQRPSMKKPEWQDPTLHEEVLDKPIKAMRSQSPGVSSIARSGRSKCSSSVLIRRSKSQERKPNSDPVALYQYYKKEWEHFRNQIPGETSHSRLRWHIRRCLLDPK